MLQSGTHSFFPPFDKADKGMAEDTVTIKIVVDDEAGPGFLAEHGFSLWVEAYGLKILFDTGQGKALLHNATVLNIVPREADVLILSHGHYDHSGGLPEVLRPPHHIHVYCHAAAFLPRYSIVDGIAEPVKMPPAAMISINGQPENKLHWVTKPLQLSEKIGITGEIPRVNDFENTGGSFYLDQDGKRADPIKDDMAFWIKTPQGLLVCIGCCHAGIINTLSYISELTGETRIHTLIGGLHLLHADTARLARTISELKRFQIQRIIPCHCTGDGAHALLMDTFSSIRGQAGMEIDIAL
jgi:7,8-dihydropterin-6-yl-methyl-4-(beta-D-ribofuranosyl)aminobenzene 5'-phosphate synthase